VEWPKEAWFDYLGGRCTLRLANAVLGWSPATFLPVPLRHGAGRSPRRDAPHAEHRPERSADRQRTLNCPKHASGLVNARLRLARSGGGRPGTGLCVGHLQLKAT